MIALVSLGLLIGRGWRREQPPVVIQRTLTGPVTATSPETGTGTKPVPGQSPVVVEQTYLCGARTKKGTPCSRRVRGPVRCWQHKGVAAILPIEKLAIKE